MPKIIKKDPFKGDMEKALRYYQAAAWYYDFHKIRPLEFLNRDCLMALQLQIDAELEKKP